jgi:DNA-binding CsgD family transcriptional regulator
VEFFAREDVEKIVALLARAGDPNLEWTVPERKRYLLEGTARLVKAEMWYWGLGAVNPSLPGDATSMSPIDGGWRDEHQRVWFYEFLTNPQLNRDANATGLEAHWIGSHRTLMQKEMCDPERDIGALNAWAEHGLGDFILSVYPVNDLVSSCAALYRRAGQARFSERDRAIVHLIFHQVDWLHRDGGDTPAASTVIRLSPRERQVLIFLLDGDSLKEVAKKLGLSRHTVGDYVKNIYRQLHVTTRAELMALFMSGGAHA